MLVTRGLGIPSAGMVTFGLGFAGASEEAVARGFASDGLWPFAVAEFGVLPLSLVADELALAGRASASLADLARHRSGEWLSAISVTGINLRGIASERLRVVVGTSSATSHAAEDDVAAFVAVGAASKSDASAKTEPSGGKQGAQ